MNIRQKILYAAITLIANGHIYEITEEKIAEKVDITELGLFPHFCSMDALFADAVFYAFDVDDNQVNTPGSLVCREFLHKVKAQLRGSSRFPMTLKSLMRIL